MAEDSVWCSAQLSHPYVNGTFVRMWWQGSTRNLSEGDLQSLSPCHRRKGIPAQASGEAVRDGALHSEEDEVDSSNIFTTLDVRLIFILSSTMD